MHWLYSVIVIALITAFFSCSAGQVQQTVLRASPREKRVAIIGIEKYESTFFFGNNTVIEPSVQYTYISSTLYSFSLSYNTNINKVAALLVLQLLIG